MPRFTAYESLCRLSLGNTEKWPVGKANLSVIDVTYKQCIALLSHFLTIAVSKLCQAYRTPLNFCAIAEEPR
jgi:hypothetical protein